MKWSIPAWCFAAALVLFGPVAWRVLSWPAPQAQVIEPAVAMAGEELFKHEWQPNDPLCNGGDGLGPVFNANSCVACHHQGGLGGAGGVEHNVTTFLFVAENQREEVKQGVLHSSATEEKFLEILQLLHPNLPATSRPTLADIQTAHVASSKPRGLPAEIQLSQRNTPALFGMGLIDLIPEQAILANERKQRVRHSMASSDSTTVAVGRVHRLSNGKIGRFGWKAQMATVAEFVEAACANELGLGNPTQAQPKSLAFADYQAPGLDLTQEQCDQLTSFVSSLPRPVEHPPSADGATGQALFSKIGCADCHTPSLGQVNGLYSDLLLHRMGDSLQGGNASYGAPIRTAPSGSNSSEPLSDEWRTPPLWGVADSAPYLHDGRANTLEDAIKMHGGQAAASAERFEGLGAHRQAQLVAFLRSLKAP